MALQLAAPLRDSVFRMLWLASLAANLTLWMNNVAAAWLMSQLTGNPTLVAMVQVASTLPVFLLGLPSGALADIVDRRRYLAASQLWIGCIAFFLAALSLGNALTPTTLLLLGFANGIGLAMRWPVFAAIIPEVVPRQQLSSALALNSISMNSSQVVGPILAGSLLTTALVGAAVFAFNSLLSTLALAMVLSLRYAPKRSRLGRERLVTAMRVGVQFVRRSPLIRALLLRGVIFFVQCTAITALLPLLARRFGEGAGIYALLLASMGVGSVVASIMMPMLRGRWSATQIVAAGIATYAVASMLAAVVSELWIGMAALLLAGIACLSTTNTLMLSAQLSLPNWVRARGMAVMQVGVLGGAALGALLWGQVATWTSVPTAVGASAAVGIVLLIVMRMSPLDPASEDDIDPSPGRAIPEPTIHIGPLDGPVMVSVEYRVDPSRAQEFIRTMERTRDARLRLGTRSWSLLRDSVDPARLVECFVDETWTEHQRRLDRFTVYDAKLRAERLAFHESIDPPVVHRLIGTGTAHE